MKNVWHYTATSIYSKLRAYHSPPLKNYGGFIPEIKNYLHHHVIYWFLHVTLLFSQGGGYIYPACVIEVRFIHFVHLFLQFSPMLEVSVYFLQHSHKFLFITSSGFSIIPLQFFVNYFQIVISVSCSFSQKTMNH